MTNESTSGPGTHPNPGEAVTGDITTVVGNANELLKEVAGSAKGIAEATGRTVEEKLRSAKVGLDQARQALVDGAKSVACRSDGYVHEHPWKVVSIAALAGLAVGLLISRR